MSSAEPSRTNRRSISAACTVVGVPSTQLAVVKLRGEPDAQNEGRTSKPKHMRLRGQRVHSHVRAAIARHCHGTYPDDERTCGVEPPRLMYSISTSLLYCIPRLLTAARRSKGCLLRRPTFLQRLPLGKAASSPAQMDAPAWMAPLVLVPVPVPVPAHSVVACGPRRCIAAELVAVHGSIARQSGASSVSYRWLRDAQIQHRTYSCSRCVPRRSLGSV